MGNTKTDTEFVSTREASRITGLSVATINRRVRDGLLTPVVEGEGPTGTRFYRRADVEALT